MQWRRSGVLVALAVTLFGVDGREAAAVVDRGLVVQTIDASHWDPPSPDTSGITYRPDTGQLVTCDSEVDETPYYDGVNLWTHSRTGVVSSTASTLGYANEPTGIVWDPAGGRLWIADDNSSRIFEVRFGADGEWGTGDDTRVTLRNYEDTGCDHLEDIAYDPFENRLYVSSGGSREICRITVGLNGVFDGAPSAGDDVVSTFSVEAYGILDPEGIVYDPLWNTLVVADRSTRDLYELTPEGDYLRKIDVDFPGGTRPSGVTIAPGSANPSLRNYWVTDRRVDNGGNPEENDGRIYEVVAIPPWGNGAPSVEAGAPQSIHWPLDTVSLAGFVSDDGHPYPPSVLSSLWSRQSGPGAVSFGSAASPATTATFSAPGHYVLQLEANDSALLAFDMVAVEVVPPTSPGTGCGIGPELAGILPLLAERHRRRNAWPGTAASVAGPAG